MEDEKFPIGYSDFSKLQKDIFRLIKEINNFKLRWNLELNADTTEAINRADESLRRLI